MFGELSVLPGTVRQIQGLGKSVYIHTDLMKGLSQDKEALGYIAETIQPTGIISTKSHMIKIAKSLGMETIHHLFIIDTNAFFTGIERVLQSKPDAVEIMPGLMPSVIRELQQHIQVPMYVGGLVKTPAQVDALVGCGVAGVVTGHTGLWGN